MGNILLAFQNVYYLHPLKNNFKFNSMKKLTKLSFLFLLLTSVLKAQDTPPSDDTQTTDDIKPQKEDFDLHIVPLNAPHAFADYLTALILLTDPKPFLNRVQTLHMNLI